MSTEPPLKKITPAMKWLHTARYTHNWLQGEFDSIAIVFVRTEFFNVAACVVWKSIFKNNIFQCVSMFKNPSNLLIFIVVTNLYAHKKIWKGASSATFQLTSNTAGKLSTHVAACDVWGGRCLCRSTACGWRDPAASCSSPSPSPPSPPGRCKSEEGKSLSEEKTHKWMSHAHCP